MLVVDDDPRFRALARKLLEASGYAIVAEAADGTEALAAAARAHPDAALVDVHLPDIDGLTLARRLTERDGGLRVVLTSTGSTLGNADALARSRAAAFVPKDRLAVTDLAPLLGD